MESPQHNHTAFLLRARRTLLAENTVHENPTRPKSSEMRYAEPEEGLLYVDTFLGHGQFVGEEAVWAQGEPVWALNYAGHVTGPGFNPDFLRDALMAATKEAPYRGPIEYQQGTLLYVNTFAGDMDWFFGREEIYHRGVSIYECVYHGGTVG